jgi:prepilin peptidase CpaA
MHFALHEMILVGSLSIFTAVAAVTDLRTRKIPNKLTVPAFILGILFQLVFHPYGDRSVVGSLLNVGAAFALGFGTLFVLWMVGGGGAGDTKMMGALSVWLGWKMTIAVLILSTVIVLIGTLAATLIQAGSRGWRKTREKLAPQAGAMTDSRNRRLMTYAFPVALATWIVLVWAHLKPLLAQ